MIRSAKRAAPGWVMLLAMLLTTVGTVQADGLPNFTKLVKENRAAVVNISNTMRLPKGGSLDSQQFLPQLPQNSPFNELFKRFFGQMPQRPHEFHEKSLGSGFVISSDGYILTAAHVVANAERIVVSLADHRVFPAKIVGSDKLSDVALLKIDAHDLPTVKIGNSTKLQVGQWVLAIGSPFGLQYTATHGIISALGRNLPSDIYVPFIQTDVPVNPGNSGGPLIDMKGDVIGINDQIYTNTGGYMGLSFSIPIKVAMSVVHQIKTKGYVSRGWLGVMIQPVTDQLAKSFGLKRPIGALVTQVIANSPAKRAGLKPGDIILQYNGRDVVDAAHLPPMVGNTPLEKEVPVKILRNRREVVLRVKIAQLPKNEQLATRGPSTPQHQGRLKIVVSDLTKAQRAKAGIGEVGVLVKEVAEGPAARAGIRPGDVILRIGSHDVRDAAQLARLVEKLPKGKPVPVLIWRHGNTLFLALTLPG
ncbi:putative periplasmic serine endoprotease DegP-like precursor [bacterium BMS3Bbin12]|nr:putative periplasmic serine endoprotease DegP-like precursor [bacterium BMS3Abin12]GBE48998.1 putative periplasmic serine endoprotease DegP-like precursor [bacterium BMS3Bbin12]GBE49330.1 putative periplasmic serine endoprotease DegP-like precursor [bacterium BMS3Bbin13]